MSNGQVKNPVQGYISLNGQHYLATGKSNNLGVLVRTSEYFKIFLPLKWGMIIGSKQN